jgi:hypothetical protein
VEQLDNRLYSQDQKLAGRRHQEPTSIFSLFQTGRLPLSNDHLWLAKMAICC